MDLKSIAGVRLACLFALCAAASGQPGPGAARVIVVEISGEPVNIARRSLPELPSSNSRGLDIERNESNAIDVCLGYVDAQLTYFWSAQRPDGRLAFAGKIRSAAGIHDGLYWPLEGDGDESPMGPKFADAAAAELDAGKAKPLFGYYFKILAAQGPQAAGGAQDYRVDGRLVSGFALVAWPAGYGVTGVRTFQVNHRGEVYAKDLGAGRSGASMAAFAPDRTWTKVASAEE